ncbi:hypothetical protein SAMN05216371_7923 [Streptomyces sp. TLI_053]|nr:hypothetical protein SAMN05216371_7923 [Streptomyces sp. TLI_053]
MARRNPERMYHKAVTGPTKFELLRPHVPNRVAILREWPPCSCGRDVCPDRGMR